MTREEAISVLNMVEAHGLADEAKKEAIKALEQEPCEDCVSRQAVLDALDKRFDSVPMEQTTEILLLRKDLRELPPVTPTRKKGKWIKKEGKEQGYDIAGIKTWYKQIMCNECGFIKNAIEGHTGQYNYCPNCGAEMESEE